MRGLALLGWLGFAALAFAQAEGGADRAAEQVEPLGFSSQVRPQQVQLGEPFLYELAVTHLAGQRFELRPPAELGAFEVLEVARSRKDGADRALTTFQVKMALFELGKKTLPDFTLDVYEEGRARRFTAPGVPIEAVSSLPPDAAEKGATLHDIKPPEEVPVRSWQLLYLLAGLLAAAALAYALFRYLQRPRQEGGKPAPPLPAEVRALRALDALRAEDLPGQGRGRDFFFRLSEILRGYLGERFAFEALEHTTPELLEALRKLPTPGLVLAEVRAFAETSDFVKFAKQEPSLDDCQRALDYAYRVVQDTTAAAQPAAPAPAPNPPSAHASGSDVP